MKFMRRLGERTGLVLGLSLLCFLLAVTQVQGQNTPFYLGIYSPVTGQSFTAPASIGIHTLVLDTKVVKTVEFFAGTNRIGLVTNSANVLLTSPSQASPFFLYWTNLAAGTYTLTAIAADTAGAKATSAPVSISVIAPPPPKPLVGIYSPANGSRYQAPASLIVYTRAVEIGGGIDKVTILTNGIPLGVVTNASHSNGSTEPLYAFAWTNIAAGNYAITSVATDLLGTSVTSTVVNITVANPPPPQPVPYLIRLLSPLDGQIFQTPANVAIKAFVIDSNLVSSVRFLSGSTTLGVVSNTAGIMLTNTAAAGPFSMIWSNAPVGNYALVAIATDAAGIMATSLPVRIQVVSNRPPVVNIFAPDPLAIEGTNIYSGYHSGPGNTNTISGTNTATFLVHREGNTNADLTVYYSIGGTAINGVDYALLPGSVTIPAGLLSSSITILPLADNDTNRVYDTVILTLTNSPSYPTNLDYLIGWPRNAGAVILEDIYRTNSHPVIRDAGDHAAHLSWPGTNGMVYCTQISTNLLDWQTICTNTVLKGSADFVDPNFGLQNSTYYRIVPIIK